MEILLEKFDKWMAVANELRKFDPADAIPKDILAHYMEGHIIEMTAEQESEISKVHLDLIQSFRDSDMHVELEDEIERNLINLENADRALKYLEYIQWRLSIIIDRLRDDLRYRMMLGCKIDFEADTSIIPPEDSIFKNPYATLVEKIASLEVDQGYVFPDDGGLGHYVESVHKDPISKYLRSCYSVISNYMELHEYIDKKWIAYGGVTKVSRSKNTTVYKRELPSFESMFYSQYQPHVDQFVNVLRELDLITTGYKWKEGKDKGASRIFFDVLKDFDVILPDKTHTPCAVIFDEKFGGLLHMFKKAPGEGAVQYQPAIEDRVRKLIEKLRKN